MGSSIQDTMKKIGIAAKQSADILANATTEQKNLALTTIANAIRNQSQQIQQANDKDVAQAKSHGQTAAFIERLTLNDESIEAMASGLEAIAELADPVGTVLASWTRPNGLEISRVRVPLGVIGVIYESRPNVTADAAALCLKAGNAVILRGGSESFHSASAIMECIQQGLEQAGLPSTSVQMVPTTDREAVGEMLTMESYIDVLVPRGGKSLIKRISDESRIPLFKHLEGICHTYIHKAADKTMAKDVVLNAKMRRTGICGATETILIDRDIIKTHLPEIINILNAAGCEVRGTAEIQAVDSNVKPVDETDWEMEYLDAIVSIKSVDNLSAAIEHINQHGSQHTDAIITDDAAAAEEFLNKVNSAIVMQNASTQFADGGEFGMGAEIGISTGKLHARGPVGVEQLTTFKYQVRGTGQTRP